MIIIGHLLKVLDPVPFPGNLLENFQELSKAAVRGGLGNAVNFSSVLYEEYKQFGQKVNYIDFNLDGDRSYGYKCWRKVEDLSLINKPFNDYTITNVAVDTKKRNEVLTAQTDIIDPDRSIL